MRSNIPINERLKFFILGALVVIGIMVLSGASDRPVLLENGRYQISSWGANFGEGTGGVGAFIVDTVSGETKTVYSRIYGLGNDKGKIIKNNLGTSFSAIK